MLALHNRPIKSKLMWIILFTSGTVLLLASTAFVVNDLFLYRRNMVAEMYTLADLVGINSSAGLIFNSPATVEENIAVLQANPHIQQAHVFNKNKELVASYVLEGFHALQHGHDEHLQAFFHDNGIDKELSRGGAWHVFHNDHIGVFKPIIFKDKHLGTVYIRSDLQAFHERLYWAAWIVFSILLVSLLLAYLLASHLQKVITGPVYGLLEAMRRVSDENNYHVRETVPGKDELGQLVQGFNSMLDKIEQRDRELARANDEITELNQRLHAENRRMGAELDVTRRLQQMVLPREEELRQIKGLEIAGFMEPASEVGGDYYDVLEYDGRVKISIGDVTGHGLESGVLMLMVQMAVRTLLANHVDDPRVFLNVLNRVIHDNVRRMSSDKNLTLALLDYQDGKLRVSGQHEEVLIVRHDGQVECLDTIDLGFLIGIESDIGNFVSQAQIELAPGEGVVLYTDGITEAMNSARECYGVERLCRVIRQHWSEPVDEIGRAVVDDLREYVADVPLRDDITLLILKQKRENIEITEAA